MDSKTLQRIDGVLKHIKIVEENLNGVSFEKFQESTLLPDAVSFSLIQIGERLIKLEELLSDKYPDVPWKSARRMRNLIVHDYDNSDPKIVYDTATKDLQELKKQFLKIKDDLKHISDNSLITERLLIRPWDDLDADELFVLAKEPEIGFWCGWEPHKSIRDTLFVLHNSLEVDNAYAICLKDSNRIIGSIGLRFKDETDLTDKDDECELGYWIGKTFWGNGYAVEAANKVLEYAFKELKVSKVWCGYYDGNDRSKKVQVKLGFEYHHRCDIVEVKQLNTTRVGYVSFLTKEKWLLKQ